MMAIRTGGRIWFFYPIHNSTASGKLGKINSIQWQEFPKLEAWMDIYVT
jgi:hypothetical protein